MRRSRHFATLAVAIMFLTVCGRNHADPPPAAEGAGSVAWMALLDVNYVFKNYSPFAEAMLQMRSKVEQAEAAIEARRQDVEGRQAQLALLEIGSATYTALTREIASAQAQLAADAKVQQQLFTQEEAGIYLRVYEEIEAACEAYARPRGLGMILRFNDAPINRNDPQDVLRYVNRPNVWHDRQLDITRTILDIMKANHEATPATAEPQPEAEAPEPLPEPEPPSRSEAEPVSGLSGGP